MEHKRRTSRRGGGASSARGIGRALLIVFAITLIAGIIVFSPIGNFLLESVIQPLFSCTGTSDEDHKIVSALSQQEDTASAATPSPKPTEKAHETISIEETPFYILQMGAFTAKDSAEEHALEIMRMGGGGVVYTDGSVYRVFAAAYLNEDSLIKVQSQVRSDGFEATPYITENKALKITLEGGKDAVSVVKDAVKLLNEIPSSFCELCLSYDKGEITAASASKQIADLQETCKDSITELAKMGEASLTPIRDLLMKYQEMLSTFPEEHDTISAELISAELKHLQLRLIIDYISFFDRK